MANKTHGSLAAEAAAYLTDSAGAVGGFNGIRQEIERQADCLLEWARRQDVFITDSYTDGLDKYGGDTSEHVVYFGSSDGRVIKCTKPGRFGYGHGPKGKFGRHPAATPLFYLRRIELMNREFPTHLKLEGIAMGKPDYKEDLSPYMVTSQRFIEAVDKNCPHPSEQEIEGFMMKLGFRLIEDSCYNWFRESDGIIITDAKMLNFVNSHEGIIPIDLIISKYQSFEEVRPATIF